MKLLIYDIRNIDLKTLDETYKNLNEFDKIKIDKLVIKKQKCLSIMGIYLLKNGLNDYYNLDYSNISILRNCNGKPYIENSNIYYNISHSNDYVICVFSNRNVGIDIEKKKKDFDIKSFTLKESYIKMKGLSIFNIKNIIINKKIDARFITLTSKDYIISICEDIN